MTEQHRTTRRTAAIPAEPGTKFSPHSWDSQIGKTVRVNGPDFTGEAKVVSAVVAPDGSSVEVTFDDRP